MKTLSGRTKAFDFLFINALLKEWFTLTEEIRNTVSENEF